MTDVLAWTKFIPEHRNSKLVVTDQQTVTWILFQLLTMTETMQKSVNAAEKNALKSVKLSSEEVIC